MQHPSQIIQSTPREVRYDKGTHWRAQLGFIVLATDLVMEENIFRLAPEGVGTSIARLDCANEITVESLAAQLESDLEG